MVDVPMMRSFEDFLINPTIVDMDEVHIPRSYPKAPRSKRLAKTPSRNTLMSAKSVKSVKPSATITDLVNEPFTWPMLYTSDEEAASPIEADDLSSLDSSSASEYDAVTIEPVVEQLATSCNFVQQQCNRAQAIKLMPAGKAHVVSIPKLIDNPTRMRRPATSTTASSSISSRRPSVRQSTATSLQSSRQSSIASAARSSTEQKLRRKQSMPISAQSSRTQLKSSSPDFLSQDPFPSSRHTSDSWPLPATPSSTTLRHKLSLSLGKFHLSRQASSSDSGSDADRSAGSSRKTSASDSSSDIVIPSRSSSTRHSSSTRKERKHIPRGADEVVPTLVLPSYPAEGSSVYPSLAPPVPERSQHRRHRSLGAILH